MGDIYKWMIYIKYQSKWKGNKEKYQDETEGKTYWRKQIKSKNYTYKNVIDSPDIILETKGNFLFYAVHASII